MAVKLGLGDREVLEMEVKLGLGLGFPLNSGEGKVAEIMLAFRVSGFQAPIDLICLGICCSVGKKNRGLFSEPK